MAPTKNPVGWFEIPVTEMERAMHFYEQVMQVKLQHHVLGPLEMAWFPWSENGIGSPGSLAMHKDFYKPSADGVLIYFTTPTGDLDKDIEQVKKAGGKILKGKTKISDEYGFMALFLDSEGNRIASHSRI